MLNKVMKSSRFSLILISISLIIAIYGTYIINDPLKTSFAYLLLLLSGLLFATYLVINIHSSSTIYKYALKKVKFNKKKKLSIVFFLSSLVSATFATILLKPNEYTFTGVFFWILSLFFFPLTFKDSFVKPKLNLKKISQAIKRNIYIDEHRSIYILIFLIAIFLRFSQLDKIPIEMTSDNIENLLDIKNISNGMHSIFFPNNTGREGFYFYVAAFLTKITPLSINFLLLKTTSALIGIISVVLTYNLGKTLFNDKIGLIAMFLMATSHWHVTLSRLGIRPATIIPFVILASIFFIKALKENKTKHWLYTGLFIGIGLNTYISFRFVPIVLVFATIIFAITDFVRKKKSKQFFSPIFTKAFWINAFSGGIFSILTSLPLLKYSYHFPDQFWFRVQSRFDDKELAVPFWTAVKTNVINAVEMFSVKGDVIFIHNIPFYPALNFVAGGLFFLGIVYLLYKVFSKVEYISVYITLLMVIMILPSVMVLTFPDENPSFTRTSGMLPFVMLTISIPIYLLLEKVNNSKNIKLSYVFATIIAIVSFYELSFVYDWYFFDYDKSYKLSATNTYEMVDEIDQFIENGGTHEQVYIVSYPYWIDHRMIGIEIESIYWSNSLLSMGQIELSIDKNASRLYIVHLNDQASLEYLKNSYPKGNSYLVNSSVDKSKNFYVVTN